MDAEPESSRRNGSRVQSVRLLKFARRFIALEAYEKSFEFYLKAFEYNSVLIHSHAEEFHRLLQKLIEQLSTKEEIGLLYKILYRAGGVYRTNPHMMNEIGKFMYELNFHNAAWKYFEMVLTIEPNYVIAEKNINSIKNLLVERWHFRMLNDHIRNECYRRALRNTVKVGDRVLDVGTGTGLLAIYAQEAGSKVTACDGSETMSEMAKRIINQNKIRHIDVITTMSISMKVSDKNMLYSLLVTEMFDAGLFGEHVLQMLYHAWPTLLSPTAKVIPNRAEFFVVAVECDVLSRKYQLTNEAKKLLRIPEMNVHLLASYDETYDCEDVHLVKDIKYLTDPVSVLKVDFNDIKDIEEILNRKEPIQVELKVNESGNANIVVGWFNLYLSDDEIITTNPVADNRANAWQQAVFFNKIPKIMKENEKINLEFFINGGQLKMSSDSNDITTKVSPEIIRFLNDSKYIKSIDNCVEEACEKFAGVVEMSEVIIADLSPFPYFGFQMLKRGAKSLVCCARNEQDIQFITEVFNENSVTLSCLTVIFGEKWSYEIFGEEKYHAIFSHYLDICGDLDLRLIDVSMHLQSEHLHKDGVFMPYSMKVVGQLVSCHWLDINNKVYDENVSKYKIANTINKYQVTQNFCIDFSLLRFVPISDPVEVGSYPDGLFIETVPVPVVNDGFANAILCWYNIQLTANSEKLSTNRTDSFVDGMLFLTNCKMNLETGKPVSLVQNNDEVGGFKLSLVVNYE